MIAERVYELLPTEWPLVIGDLPSTNNVVVGIMEYGGATSTEYFGDKDGSSIYGPIVKIVIRHTSYATGQQWATQIRDTLHRYHDDSILSILLVGAAIYLGRSPEKLHEFQVTLRSPLPV